MNKKFYLSVVVLASLLLSQLSVPGSIRCGNHVISDGGRNGPTQYEVLKKCGDPKYKDSLRWVYNKSGAEYVLRFSSNGILVDVKRT